MIFQLGVLLAASFAAFAIRQINAQNSRESTKSQKDEAPVENVGNDGEIFPEQALEFKVEEEKEEVKLISRTLSPAGSEDVNKLLTEFESLLSGEIDFPLSADKLDASANMVYDYELENNAIEIERLRNLVKEMEEREAKLEGELFEYYGLEEQQSNIAELQEQLKMKSVEIDMLQVTINSLQAERKKLEEEVSEGVAAKIELENAKMKIKEQSKQIQIEASQSKGQLLLLKQQVSALQAKEQEVVQKDEVEKKLKAVEVELMELKRKNRELQHEKMELIAKLDAAESNVKLLSTMYETETVAKARDELKGLTHKNEDLVKQVEGLQTNRFCEVEELLYLRLVNACLRYELQNYQSPSEKISARDLGRSLSPRSREKARHFLLEYAGSERGDTDIDSNFDSTSVDSEELDNTSVDSSFSKLSSNKKPSLLQKLKRLGKSRDTSGSGAKKISASMEGFVLRNAGDRVATITSLGTSEKDDLNSPETPKSDQVRVQDPSSDGLDSVTAQLMSKSIEGVVEEKYPAFKDRLKLATEREKKIKEKAQQARVVRFGDPLSSLPPNDSSIENTATISPIVSKMLLSRVEKRAPRVARPPPKPSSRASSAGGSTNAQCITPPPPPPAPRSLSKGSGGSEKVQRASELVEFYQVLMKREAKKETSSFISSSLNTTDGRSNILGEMVDKSSILLAVKADVETQGDFVMSLAAEVRASSFTNIDDLVAFVNWLDEELSFLVDERGVLKHFDWPEGKTDALREAAFEYQDLLKLEKLVSSFVDDPSLPCDAALEKMYKLLEKVEQSVYALMRTRDMTASRYKEFCIPFDWLQDSGLVGKIKLSSVQLAQKYMKRVATELDAINKPDKEPNREFLILQGIRFAFRVHQFAGGFDEESMKAFEELRSRAQITQDQNQQQG